MTFIHRTENRIEMKRHAVWAANRIGLLSLILVVGACGGGGGGGGGGSNTEQAPSGATVGESMNTDQPDAELGFPDREDTVVQDPEVQDPEFQDGDYEGNTVGGGATAQLAVISGTSAVGVDGGTILNVADLTINRGGGLAFHSRVQTPLVDSSRAQSHVFAGSLTSQQVVIAPDTAIVDLPAGFNFESSIELSVASDGTVATVARIRDEGLPGDFFDGSASVAVIRADASGATSLVTVDDMVSTLNGEVQLSTIDQVSISQSGVAFLGRIRSRGSSFALFVQDDDGFKSVAEGLNSSGEGAPTIDGCRVLLTSNSTQQFRMLDSGALVFNATIDGGRTSSPCQSSQSAVLRYANGTLSVIVREGDPVPGSSTFLFGSLELRDVLPDGSVLINSTISDSTRGRTQRDIILRQSAWLITHEDELRLVYVEGETLQRSDGSVELELGNFAPGFKEPMRINMAVNSSGPAAVSVQEVQFSPSALRLSVHTGTVQSVQPHSSLETPGASNLVLSDEAYANAGFPGSPILALPGSPGVASGFAETDRLFPIGAVAIDSQGNLYFHARVLDTQTLTQKGDYVFRRDVSGQLSVVVSPLDRVMVNGREELILSSVINSDFGSRVQGILVRLIAMEDDSLLIHDVGKGSAVLLKFP